MEKNIQPRTWGTKEEPSRSSGNISQSIKLENYKRMLYEQTKHKNEFQRKRQSQDNTTLRHIFLNINRMIKTFEKPNYIKET